MLYADWTMARKRRSAEVKDKVRDIYVQSHATGNPMTLKDAGNLFGIPHGTVLGWSQDEGWGDMAALASASHNVDARGLHALQPVIQDETRAFLQEATISGQVKESVDAALEDSIQSRLTPILEVLVEHEAVLWEMRAAGLQALRSVVACLPTDSEDAVEKGFSPKDLVTLLSTAKSLITESIVHERVLHDKPGHLSAQQISAHATMASTSDPGTVAGNLALANGIGSMARALEKLGVAPAVKPLPQPGEVIDASFEDREPQLVPVEEDLL